MKKLCYQTLKDQGYEGYLLENVTAAGGTESSARGKGGEK